MKEMPLQEHLEDLRKMLIRILIILFLSFFVAYSFGELISEFLLYPLRVALKDENVGGGNIVYLGILDKMLSQIQVAFWSSILFSCPLWFREVWVFLKPGLYEKEIKIIRPFFAVGLILFISGVLFAYYIVFPITFQALLSTGVKNVEASLSLKDYLVLSSQILVFMGLVFQLPNVMLILGFMGLVTKYSLRSMRRYIYFGLAVISAIITPPDVITMLGLWIPLVLLFEVGIWAVALIVHPYLAKQTLSKSS